MQKQGAKGRNAEAAGDGDDTPMPLAQQPSFSLLQDYLPEELQCCVCSFLDAPTLGGNMRRLNRYFHDLCGRDEAGWENLCQILWRDKIHVCEQARLLQPARRAYQATMDDAQNRDCIRLSEFLYNPTSNTGTIWSFRFKQSAGPDWSASDPWWAGNEARRMVFLQNGEVKQYVVDEHNTTEHHLSNPTFGRLIDPPIPMNWRWILRPMDLPARPQGSYVRFNVAGRDVPTYVMRRSPNNNWGFVMESCWGVYTSFSMPKRRVHRVGRRMNDMIVTMEVADEEDDDDEGDESDDNEVVHHQHHHQDDPDQALRDDSAMVVTNAVQWREALLYNFGARVLPEGDDDLEEFEQTWGQTLHART
jgi:hypothetical protein